MTERPLIMACLVRHVLWAVLALVQTPVYGKPATLDSAMRDYTSIHPRLFQVVKARTSGEGCGNWYAAYSQLHAAVRSNGLANGTQALTSDPDSTQAGIAPQQLHHQQQTQRSYGWLAGLLGHKRQLLQQQQQQQQQQPKPRYAVMVSVESGLADRLGCSLSAFFYALLTDRVFEYVWYGHHVLWESYQSPWVDWRAPPRDPTRGATVPAPPGSPSPVLPVVTENHHWSQPNRTVLDANFYLNPPDAGKKAWVQSLFGSGDLLSYGSEHDTVQWMSNMGLLSRAFRNPRLARRLQELGLTWERSVPCLFNYLYVPSPAALTLFRRGPLLDTLLDPNNIVIGIQVRIGDWVWKPAAQRMPFENPGDLMHGQGHFSCAQQLTDQLVAEGLAEAPVPSRRSLAASAALRGGGGGAGGGGGGGGGRQLAEAAAGRRRVYWLLLSDSPAFREAARRHFGDGRLLVADVPIDHVQDFPRHRQVGLHAATAELWLFGLAHLHVVSVNSAFGRLGAVAGGPKPLGSGAPKYQIYGMSNGRTRDCRLSQPDSLDSVADWWVGLRRSQ